MERDPSTGRHPRFVRAEIAEHPGGGLVVRTPRETTLRVHLDGAEFAAILDRCDGSRPLDDVAAGSARAPEVRSLLSRLDDGGCFSTLPDDESARHWVRFAGQDIDPSRPHRTELVVIGAGRLASVMASAMAGVVRARFAGLELVPDIAGLRGCPGHDGQLAVCLTDFFDLRLLADLDAECARHGIPWSYLCHSEQRGRFGPHFSPQSGPSFSDLRARLAAAASETQPRLRHDRAAYLPPDPELLVLLSLFFVDLERWLAGAPASGNWHEVEVDTVRQVVTRHPVLPLPDAAPGGTAASPQAPAGDLLVDDRSGIIKFVTENKAHESAPDDLIIMTAVTSDVSRVRPWRTDPSGGGSSFGDRDAARSAAIGEAIERYCGNIIQPQHVIQASYHQLIANGENAIDPERLVLFSDTQYASPGFPFVPLRRDTVIDWYRGRSLTRCEHAWLPASLVYVNWYRASRAAARPTNGTYYPGIAAGATVEMALASGLQELVERHATMVWWLNGKRLPAIRLTGALSRRWKAKSMRAWLIYLENEFGIPVIAGVVDNSAESLLTVGFAARADAGQAAQKAWCEALVLQELSRDLQDPDGSYRRAIARGRLAQGELKPWRSDRRYRDSYRADFRDVVSLLSQSQLHLDPRAQDLARPFLEADEGLSLEDVPALAVGGLRVYQEAVEAAGYEIYFADVTTPDVALTGLAVTRVVVPGLVPNFPAAFPFLGQDAIQQCAVKLGWRSSMPAASELNYVPLPHA